MKPVIITLNSDNKVVMSVEEFKRHMGSAYNQGYSDGQSTTITTPYYGNQRWWTDITCSDSTNNKCAANKLNITYATGSYTDNVTADACDCVAGYCNCDTECSAQVSIKDYIKSKGE